MAYKKQRTCCADKVCLVKAMVLWVVMWGCESWTIKKDWVPKIDVFRLWCWRRLLTVPWTERSYQSILKKINPGYSLKGLMLKLKLQYFGHLIRRTDSLEKTLMLQKIRGRRRKGWATEDKMVGWHHWLTGEEFEQTPGDGEVQRSLACCCPWGCRVRHDLTTEQQQLGQTYAKEASGDSKYDGIVAGRETLSRAQNWALV